jgi:hypothetical protein
MLAAIAADHRTLPYSATLTAATTPGQDNAHLAYRWHAKPSWAELATQDLLTKCPPQNLFRSEHLTDEQAVDLSARSVQDFAVSSVSISKLVESQPVIAGI